MGKKLVAIILEPKKTAICSIIEDHHLPVMLTQSTSSYIHINRYNYLAISHRIVVIPNLFLFLYFGIII